MMSKEVCCASSHQKSGCRPLSTSVIGFEIIALFWMCLRETTNNPNTLRSSGMSEGGTRVNTVEGPNALQPNASRPCRR